MNEKRIGIIAIVVLLQVRLLISCGSETSADSSAISDDPAAVTAGDTFFNQHCSGCHSFRRDGIGPRLTEK